MLRCVSRLGVQNTCRYPIAGFQTFRLPHQPTSQTANQTLWKRFFSNETSVRRPLVLCILDGWGHREEKTDNAIAMAATPVYNNLLKTQPWSLLNASEKEVGLPSGQIGNSEVGHMNLGAGRVVYQDILMIDQAVQNNELHDTTAVKELIETLKKTGGTCHLMGLLSPGGVHSMQDHVAALANTMAQNDVPVAIHAFTDGRDTPPKDAIKTFPGFLEQLKGPNNRVATVIGRYWSMDRDNRWDRVKQAYDAMAFGEGKAVSSDPMAAITQAYEKGVTDEFIEPTVVGQYNGFQEGDAILFANFRADRVREILSAFVDPKFDGFERGDLPQISKACGMVVYSEDLANYVSAIFPPKKLENVLGEIISRNNMTQLRIAETEKYPHVTFFFNGGRETPFEGEDRIMIPSPKVATYDLAPAMSADVVTDNLVEAIESDKYDVIIANYANPDMVGHTGSLEASVVAVETIDKCLQRLVDSVQQQNGTMLVTADHGNVEQMRDGVTGEPHTAHTLNLVPFVLINGPEGVTVRDGKLSDVAATMLNLMDMPKPDDMTGQSLLN